MKQLLKEFCFIYDNNKHHYLLLAKHLPTGLYKMYLLQIKQTFSALSTIQSPISDGLSRIERQETDATNLSIYTVVRLLYVIFVTILKYQCKAS
jgi:hypothetical protein